jgi:hypothetical protein
MYWTRMTHRARGLFAAASAVECVAYGVKYTDEGARRLYLPHPRPERQHLHLVGGYVVETFVLAELLPRRLPA